MYPLAKRCFDVLAALAGLCVLAPALLCIALLVAACDGRPVLYRELRLGRQQRPFSLIKFRTLYHGSPVEPHVAAEGDPRVTRLGRWLRRWRLDEFPALFNVLKGDMSLVGPRPMVASHAQRLTAAQRSVIYSVRPGLTDLAAVQFLAEDAVLATQEQADAVYFEQLFHPKMEVAVAGIGQASFLGDITLVLTTARQLWSADARRESESLVRALLQKPTPGSPLPDRG